MRPVPAPAWARAECWERKAKAIRNNASALGRQTKQLLEINFIRPSYVSVSRAKVRAVAPGRKNSGAQCYGTVTFVEEKRQGDRKLTAAVAHPYSPGTGPEQLVAAEGPGKILIR